MVVDPQIPEGEEVTVVEPGALIHFQCVTDGRPTPSVSYTWIPAMDASEGGEEPVPMALNPDEEGGKPHSYQTVLSTAQTHTRRTLECSAQNVHGTVSDRHAFDVVKPGSAPVKIETAVDPDNTVTITWSPPVYPNGKIDRYFYKSFLIAS